MTLCTTCSGRGFHWKHELTTRQTVYGQDLQHYAFRQGDRCETCGGSGEAKLTLTGFGWSVIFGCFAAFLVLLSLVPT